MAFYPGIVGTKIQPKDFLHSFPSNHLNFVLYAIVKLRSRSRSGEGQVRVRQVRVSQSPAQRTQNSKIWTKIHTIILVFTTTTLHHKLFSWLLRGLHMSDGPRIKLDYRGDISEYFKESLSYRLWKR